MDLGGLKFDLRFFTAALTVVGGEETLYHGALTEEAMNHVDLLDDDLRTATVCEARGGRKLIDEADPLANPA